MRARCACCEASSRRYIAPQRVHEALQDLRRFARAVGRAAAKFDTATPRGHSGANGLSVFAADAGTPPLPNTRRSSFENNGRSDRVSRELARGGALALLESSPLGARVSSADEAEVARLRLHASLDAAEEAARLAT